MQKALQIYLDNISCIFSRCRKGMGRFFPLSYSPSRLVSNEPEHMERVRVARLDMENFQAHRFGFCSASRLMMARRNGNRLFYGQ